MALTRSLCARTTALSVVLSLHPPVLTAQAPGPTPRDLADRLHPSPPLGSLLLPVAACPGGADRPETSAALPPPPALAAPPVKLSTRPALEILAVAATGAGHPVANANHADAVFIGAASLGWASYVAYRARREEGYLAELGLTRSRLGPSFGDASLVSLAGTAVMAGIAAERGTLRLDGDVLPLLLMYPAWGVAQQTLVQGMMARNLASSAGWMASPWFTGTPPRRGGRRTGSSRSRTKQAGSTTSSGRTAASCPCRAGT